MAIGPRKVIDLPKDNDDPLEPQDYLVVERVTGATSKTAIVSYENLTTNLVKGPFDTDSAAEAGGIPINTMYFTSTGEVRIRLV